MLSLPAPLSNVLSAATCTFFPDFLFSSSCLLLQALSPVLIEIPLCFCCRYENPCIRLWPLPSSWQMSSLHTHWRFTLCRTAVQNKNNFGLHLSSRIVWPFIALWWRSTELHDYYSTSCMQPLLVQKMIDVAMELVLKKRCWHEKPRNVNLLISYCRRFRLLNWSARKPTSLAYSGISSSARHTPALVRLLGNFVVFFLWERNSQMQKRCRYLRVLLSTTKVCLTVIHSHIYTCESPLWELRIVSWDFHPPLWVCEYWGFDLFTLITTCPLISCLHVCCTNELWSCR